MKGGKNMKRLSYNDMSNAAGGYTATIRDGQVHLKGLTPGQRLKIIEAFSKRGDRVINPYLLINVGDKPYTYADCANNMRQDSELNSVPEIPLNVAASIFKKDEKLQEALNNPRRFREYKYGGLF